MDLETNTFCNIVVMMSVGVRIKAARLAAGLGQAELAELCGWGHNQGRISHYETGKRYPDPDDMVLLENALGLHRGALMGAAEFAPTIREKDARNYSAASLDDDFEEIMAGLSEAGKLKAYKAIASQLTPKDAIKLARILLARAEAGI